MMVLFNQQVPTIKSLIISLISTKCLEECLNLSPYIVVTAEFEVDAPFRSCPGSRYAKARLARPFPATAPTLPCAFRA
jgi:hypothetical protein